MEKKKLLLVAVSVGVVLLIIIGIPLVLLTPRQNTALAATVPTETSPEYPRVIESPGVIQIIDGATEQEITRGTQSETASPQSPVEIPYITTITVPTPRTVAVPDTPPVRSAPKPMAVAPAKPQQTARPQVTASKPVQTEPAKTTTNYWVQTGAFSTKIRAEGVKETLETKGIISIIDNRDINGKTWYRVRVGPYVSETEANYWLTLVKSIEGFGDSQVRQTLALR